jgi:hypothetical protein
VQIDQSGRPVERLPQAAPEPAEASDVTSGTQTTLGGGTTGGKPADPGLPLPLLIGGGVLAALIGGLLYAVSASKPSPLRIVGGPGGPKEYSLKGGQTLTLGGGAHAYDSYPLGGAGVAAVVKGGSGGRFTLSPPSPPAPGTPAPAAAGPAPKVFHNGLPLEKPAPLGYGDEVRVAVPDASGAGVAREFRLKFEDPTQKF